MLIVDRGALIAHLMQSRFDLDLGYARQSNKVRSSVSGLNVTLEKLYTGCEKTLKLSRNVICQKCKGAGGENVTKCANCRGAGIEIVTRHIGPMMHRVQQRCSSCNGEGEIIRDVCKTCNGKKRVCGSGRWQRGGAWRGRFYQPLYSPRSKSTR